ncbi:MAG TPA: serine/threonine-protein kinase [Myxococcaceae bacterium]
MQCPDENTLVAFTHRLLGADERPLVESHLRGCSECRQVIALLAEAQPSPGAEASSEEDPSVGSGEPLPPLPERMLSPGMQLGRYILLRPLGVGGMGVVYAAYDSELARTVALKLLREGQSPSEEARARLQREARAMARLTSPYVLPVYDVGTWRDQVFVTMELVEGGTLTHWLAEQPRGWREVRRVFLEAGRGLAAAHAAGLIHRDFKPDNVLVGADGRVRVTDFGLARSTQASEPPAGAKDGRPPVPQEPGLTQQGTLMGTPAYMSPEQFEGRPVDARSDQFSFCVALYEGLYGHRPRAGASPEALEQALKLRLPPARTRVPAWLRRVVLRGLSADPQGRFASMEALLEALRDDPGVRRRRWALGAGVLGLVLAVAAGMHLVGERRSQLCKGAERKLEHLWDGPVRKEAEAAFLATGKPHAANAWKTVATGLDRYTAEWTGAHVEACEATRVRGEQSEQALDLRMACLERRRRELGALMKVLREADASLLDRAPSAVQALKPVTDCADVETLRIRPSLPEGEPQRSRAEALTQTLAEVGVLYDMGRFIQGLEVAQRALEEARALGFAPLEAEALLLVGQMQERLGKKEDGEKTVLESVLTAHAAGRPDLAVNGYLQLAWVTQKRPEVAHSWARFASALIRATGNEPRKQAHLLHNEAFILLEQSRPLEASERLLQAATLMERELGPDSLRLASVLTNAAAVLDQLERQSEALPLAKRSLAIHEKAMGPEDPNLVPSLHTIASIQGSLDDSAGALEHERRATKILESTLGPEHPWMATLLNTMGTLLILEGREAEAWEVWQRSVALDEKLHGAENVESTRAIGNMSRSLLRQGRHAEALTYAERAFQTARKRLGAEHELTAFFQVDVAHCLLAQGKAAQALELFQRALVILEKSRGAESRDLAKGLTGQGRSLVELGQPKQAVALLERALRLREGARVDEAAETKFALARAVAAVGTEPARARALAEQARSGFQQAGPRATRALAEVDRWLQSSP